MVAEPKRYSPETDYVFPAPGGRLMILAVSADGRRDYIFDISRNRIRLERVSYQLRARRTDILRRLCLNGKRHTNPDVQPPVDKPELLPVRGLTMIATHLHVYVEGFEDAWAVPPPDILVSDSPDLVKTFRSFARLCGLAETPILSRGLDFFWGPNGGR